METFGPDDAADMRLKGRRARFMWKRQPVTLQPGAGFNIINQVAAASCTRAPGIRRAVLAEGLSPVSGVRGRFEAIDAGQPLAVLVDDAHTPEALEQARHAAREPAESRLLAVFGAGGDRDHEKRLRMGAAATLADLAVVTSDNLRLEDPESIIAQVVPGADESSNLVIESDRAEAISTGLATAGRGDVVLIAGKGHEAGQYFGGRVLPFDDVDTARTSLARIPASRRPLP
jgi:UDP-N-acetylmuramoyl-L-alanyl-D-glutamate--2,6-diaminopimelate ligase